MSQISVCIISDHIRLHYTTAVYAFHKVHIRYIRQNHPQATGIKYFSDGSYAQYTNHQNFSNFYHHKDDFGFSAEWILLPNLKVLSNVWHLATQKL